MDSTKREPETLSQNNVPEMSESPIMNHLSTPRSNDHPATTVESQSEGMVESFNEGAIERISESRSDSQNQSPFEMSVSTNSDNPDQEEVHSGGAEASHAAFITITPTAEVELSVEMSNDYSLDCSFIEALDKDVFSLVFSQGSNRNMMKVETKEITSQIRARRETPPGLPRNITPI